MKKPRLIIWVLTAKCNLDCCHCYTARFIGRDELDEYQALQVVKSGAEEHATTEVGGYLVDNEYCQLYNLSTL